MGIEQRIRLWHELSGYTRELHEACDLAQKNFDAADDPGRLKNIEEMIRVFRATIASLHLLRSESELLGALISHDFLNRFYSVHMRLEQLVRKVSRERLDRVCRSIWIIRQVIESLVFWIDHQSILLQRVALDDYIKRATDFLQEIFVDIQLVAHVNKVDLQVLMYEPIMTNFIINAVVNAHKHGGATKVEFVVDGDLQSAILRIQDNGAGIPVPYERISSGLGLMMIDRRLAVMKAILQVDVHGGIEGGALFHIVFPISQEQEKTVQLPGSTEMKGDDDEGEKKKE